MSNDPYNTGLVEKDNLSEWFGGVGHSYAYCVTPPVEYANTWGADSCTNEKGFYDPDSCRQDNMSMKNIKAWGGTILGYTGSFFNEIKGTVHSDCNGITGNKYGLSTGTKCIDKQGILKPKYTYINNTTSGLLAGQIPGTLYSAKKIPMSSVKIGTSFVSDLKPQCSKVRLKYHLVDSTKEGQARSGLTRPVHVANDELRSSHMNSNYQDAFSNINNNNNNNHNNNLAINLLLLAILSIIVFKLLNK